MSGFIPRHIEHPASRQSKPAARKTSSRPSRSAWALTCSEPGTTIAWTPSATLRPSTTSAAARRSPIREFVHEPMKTRSRRMSWIGVPGRRSMYSSARSSPSSWRLGHRVGDADDHVRVRAPGDHRADRGGVDARPRVSKRRVGIGRAARATASSTSTPRSREPGERACRRARSCRRARRPRSSCCRPSCGPPSRAPRSPAPAYSTTWPAAPATPIWPIVARIRSLAVTPKPSSPS